MMNDSFVLTRYILVALISIFTVFLKKQQQKNKKNGIIVVLIRQALLTAGDLASIEIAIFTSKLHFKK